MNDLKVNSNNILSKYKKIEFKKTRGQGVLVRKFEEDDENNAWNIETEHITRKEFNNIEAIIDGYNQLSHQRHIDKKHNMFNQYVNGKSQKYLVFRTN